MEMKHYGIFYFIKSQNFTNLNSKHTCQRILIKYVVEHNGNEPPQYKFSSFKIKLCKQQKISFFKEIGCIG